MKKLWQIAEDIVARALSLDKECEFVKTTAIPKMVGKRIIFAAKGDLDFVGDIAGKKFKIEVKSTKQKKWYPTKSNLKPHQRILLADAVKREIFVAVLCLEAGTTPSRWFIMYPDIEGRVERKNAVQVEIGSLTQFIRDWHLERASRAMKEFRDSFAPAVHSGCSGLYLELVDSLSHMSGDSGSAKWMIAPWRLHRALSVLWETNFSWKCSAHGCREECDGCQFSDFAHDQESIGCPDARLINHDSDQFMWINWDREDDLEAGYSWMASDRPIEAYGKK